MKLGSLVTRRPRAVLLVSSVLCGVALAAAALVRVDHARIENFNESEPLYVADREINRTLAGTNHLDIVIEAGAADGILEPATLRKIEGLQRYVQTLDGVGAVTSIVDYIKQLNRAVDGGGEASYVIPDDRSLIAQLMLTYQASAPPTEFQSLIDSANRTALVRVWLRADRWSEQRKVVLATRSFIEREFGNGPVTATLTGRVMLDYEWVQSVASGHAFSVLASTLSVLLMCIVIFRSFRDGLLCLAPLFVSVVLVYAVMGSVRHLARGRDLHVRGGGDRPRHRSRDSHGRPRAQSGAHGARYGCRHLPTSTGRPAARCCSTQPPSGSASAFSRCPQRRRSACSASSWRLRSSARSWPL